MLNKLSFILIILVMITTIHSQVKDYEIGRLDRTRTNSASGYFDFSESGEINMKVSVWGFVKYPGRYLIPANTTVTDLLSYAGGPIDDAHLYDLRLYRMNDDSTNELFKFDYNDLLWEEELRLEERNLPYLTAGDILLIPGAERLYFKDWASLGLSFLSVLISMTTLIVTLSK